MTHAARPIDPAAVLRLLAVASILPILSALSLTAILYAGLGASEAGFVIWIAAATWAHGFFIAVVTDMALGVRFARPAGEPGLGMSLRIAIKAAPSIAAPLAAALGVYVATNDRRWSLLGWALLVAPALPARVVCRLRGERPAWRPASTQLAAAAAALVLIDLPGWPIQTCTGECWGLFEGGIVAVPLLGLYLFMASLSAALLSALAVQSLRRD